MRLLLCCLLLVACGKPNPDACCTTADDCLKYGFAGIMLSDSYISPLATITSPHF